MSGSTAMLDCLSNCLGVALGSTTLAVSCVCPYCSIFFIIASTFFIISYYFSTSKKTALVKAVFRL